MGQPAVDEAEETKRRITPWFTRAGFGGLLIDAEDDDFGFRRIVGQYKTLIDEALQDDPIAPPSALVSRTAYLKYLTDQPVIVGEPPSATDEVQVRSMLADVNRYGQTKIICLSGLPGTGKSRLAKLVASQIADGDPYRFMEIQFHESISYEDFIEGFVPRPSGEGFELVPKSFLVMNRRASTDPEGRPFVLLIEEFSRANVHSVLGELITYVEHRERPFRLALSQRDERVARNLVIIATLNPRDKSALALDQAILRRMHQVTLAPSVELLRAMLGGRLDPAILNLLIIWFERHIESLPFGHGVFAGAESEDDLRSIWTGTLRYFLVDTTGGIQDRYRAIADEYPWQ